MSQSDDKDDVRDHGDHSDLPGVRALMTRPVLGPDASRSPSRPLRATWSTPRRRAAVAALSLLAGWAILPAAPLSLLGWAVLALTALGAALTWATYVPERGQRLGDLIGSPCGIGGALFPLLGLMAATTPGAGFSGQVMGLGFVGMGLAQRLFGGDACRR